MAIIEAINPAHRNYRPHGRSQVPAMPGNSNHSFHSRLILHVPQADIGSGPAVNVP
jgi:hypothetical protein